MAEYETEVMKISQLTVCNGYIKFEEVLPVIARIEEKLKEIDKFAKLHKVAVLREVGNRFEPRAIEVNYHYNQISVGNEVFWACVCLGLEKAICKVFTTHPTKAEITRIEVTG